MNDKILSQIHFICSTKVVKSDVIIDHHLLYITFAIHVYMSLFNKPKLECVEVMSIFKFQCNPFVTAFAIILYFFAQLHLICISILGVCNVLIGLLVIILN